MIWYVNDKQVATGPSGSIPQLPKGRVVLKLIGTDDRGRLGGAQLCLWVSDTSVKAATTAVACSPGSLRDPKTGRLVGAKIVTTEPDRMVWVFLVLAALVVALLVAIGLLVRIRRNAAAR